MAGVEGPGPAVYDADMTTASPRAELYTWSYCPYCVRAKDLLTRRGVAFTEHVMDGKDRELDQVKARYGHSTVPIVLLDGQFVGGYRELAALDGQGKLKGG
jgi:glutaredoxin 3